MAIYDTPGKHLSYPKRYWWHSLRTAALDVLRKDLEHFIVLSLSDCNKLHALP
jgi:hypothetical protein